MTAASILALVESIEGHGVEAPSALAFRSALSRKGREAYLAGGSATLAAIRREITLAEGGACGWPFSPTRLRSVFSDA